MGSDLDTTADYDALRKEWRDRCPDEDRRREW